MAQKFLNGYYSFIHLFVRYGIHPTAETGIMY